MKWMSLAQEGIVFRKRFHPIVDFTPPLPILIITLCDSIFATMSFS